jgi:hypothetical protein
MNIVVLNHVSLDGVMQSPGSPGEDTREGFIHGGWAAAGGDPVMAEWIGPIGTGDWRRDAPRSSQLRGHAERLE